MARREKVNYLSNTNLLEQVGISKANGKMSNDLTKMLMLLCDRYSTKSNFAGYTFIDDMRMFALLNLCKTWSSFNAEKSNNPFAYYTQNIKNSFIQYLKNEKKQRNIRDMLLVSHGVNPSHTYSTEYAEEHHVIDPAEMYNTYEAHHETVE